MKSFIRDVEEIANNIEEKTAINIKPLQAILH